jgi:hypothetical protein
MTLDEYLALIPAQHRHKPRYMATVEALLKPLQGTGDLLEELRLAFDLDTAIGAQLDAVGVRVGRSRLVDAPLDGVYFSWDTEGVGWDEGIWKGPHDPDYGLVSLPDDLYRLLLMGKVAANAWDSTIPHAYEIWNTAFGGTSSIIFIEDHQDMSMTVGISGKALAALFLRLLLRGYVPLKPEGVRVEWVMVTVTGPIFAWDTRTDALDGWEIGSWPAVVG